MNEDYVSIILKFEKPPTISSYDWPECSFFAIYDGHGGSGCANFLKQNLHALVKDTDNQ